MSRVLKSIDLFAGIGGIRLGFENAFKNEIETVFVSEWDEHAQKTYRDNFSDDFEIAGDITRINEQNIPAFDICLAGFPSKMRFRKHWRLNLALMWNGKTNP